MRTPPCQWCPCLDGWCHSNISQGSSSSKSRASSTWEACGQKTDPLFFGQRMHYLDLHNLPIWLSRTPQHLSPAYSSWGTGCNPLISSSHAATCPPLDVPGRRPPTPRSTLGEDTNAPSHHQRDCMIHAASAFAAHDRAEICTCHLACIAGRAGRNDMDASHR